MKIDLHCHTKKSKKGDSEKRNVSVEKFIENIENADVKIAAITNHNEFDIEQYNKIINKNIDFQLWPGIEFDVNYKEEEAHLIIIANPKKVDEFNKTIKEIIRDRKPDEISINIDIIIDKFKDKDVLFLGHSFGKNKKISKAMNDKLMEGINENHRLFLEPSSYKTLSVMVDYGFRAIMGSDIENWEEYFKCELPELKLEIDSFEKFILLAKKDTSTINTLLQKKEKKDITINIKINDKKYIKETIPIYNDINIIFGLKGTGKSRIIDGFYEKFVNDGVSCA